MDGKAWVDTEQVDAEQVDHANEQELFGKLSHELWKNYCAAKQIANYMQHKANKNSALQPEMLTPPLVNDSWFLL